MRRHIVTTYEATRFYQIYFNNGRYQFVVNMDDSLGRVYTATHCLMREHGFKSADIVDGATSEVLYSCEMKD